MELNIVERIALLNVLPNEGNIITLRILKDLRSALSFTEGELEKFKMKTTTFPDGRMSIVWDEDFNKETSEIEIGKAAHGIVVQALTSLDRRQQLKTEAITIYEKFVEAKKVD